MRVTLKGHESFYGVGDIVRLFFDEPKENREEGFVECQGCDELEIVSQVGDRIVKSFVTNSDDLRYRDLSVERNINEDGIPSKREVKRQLYELLSQITGKSFPWGSLTGIRPTIVARELNSASELTSKYLVREDKAKRAIETARNEDMVLARQGPDALNVYVGVPFCPSRCEYCSFISQDITKHMDLLHDYSVALMREIEGIGRGLELLGREVSTVYFGGGTPTVFEDRDFANVVECFGRSVKLAKNCEFTIEAGRPDTINEFKLRKMREAGVQRVCINPQTMCDETLRRLNRKHNSKDVLDCIELSRKVGFEIINTDLIAGLKYEDASQLNRSLEVLFDYEPENITIHSLYKKKNARMSREDCLSTNNGRGSVDEEVSKAYDSLDGRGYLPYYMYRQKDTGFGLENVGFAKEGTECLYNVAMMSDRADVLAIGAGAISKRVFEGNRIERCPCVKDAIGYMNRVDEMIDRKMKFFE